MRDVPYGDELPMRRKTSSFSWRRCAILAAATVVVGAVQILVYAVAH